MMKVKRDKLLKKYFLYIWFKIFNDDILNFHVIKSFKKGFSHREQKTFNLSHKI